jgi:class 3 adenylate cyclase/HAMP domain-containing protein
MRIFTKLFLLLAGLVIVPLGVVAFILIHNTGAMKDQLTTQVNLTGDLVSDKSEKALLRQVELTHLKIIQEKAGRLEGFFETIRAAVLLESTLIRQFLESDAPARPPYELFPADEVNYRRDNDPQWKQRIFAKQPYTMYQLVAGVDPDAAEPTLDRLRQLGGFFAHSFHVVPGCASIYLGHRDGITFGYPGGSRFSPQYDPRKRPWYLLAAPNRQITWTPVYLDRGDNDLIVTCAHAVFSQSDGSLLAVAAMDVKLTELLRELFALGDLQVSQAMLIDDQDRVRVSATYVDGEARFDRDTLLNPQTVEHFADAGLRRVFEKIDAAGAGSGILYGPAEPGDEGSLYIHAPVRFRSDAGAGERAGLWRYVLRVPLAPVVRPAQAIRADIGGATDQMRATMESEVVKLAAVVGVITAASMGVAVALAFFFAGSATRPLVQMQHIAGRIATGDFNQQVVVRSRDEIGQLGSAINEMIVGLKEREFIKKTFKRYVAASIVDELIKDPSKAHLGGERKDLSIFFSDLSGFTTLSEHYPPHALVALLNEYLGAMTDAIFAQEGTLDKYIGDAIVAFWGAPIGRQDDALRACRTALANLDKLAQLWLDWDRRGLPRLDVRIGIHTGPVVVGNIGSDVQMNYTVVGDTANTSSRLEGANKVYGTRILIGERTRRDAGDAIVAREIDLIAVKGKTDSVRIFELVGLKNEVVPQRLEGIHAFEAALAWYRGRRWDEAEAGFRRAIAILGTDPPSVVFLKRIEAYRAAPPGDTWGGVFVMTEK